MHNQPQWIFLWLNSFDVVAFDCCLLSKQELKPTRVIS